MKRMNNDGATSILIIMLMVVLMVFGLTILTATLSNETLSDKKLEWLDDFYALESKAAVKLSEIDEKLESLKIQAMDSSEERSRSERYKELIKSEFESDDTIYISISEEQGEYLKYIDMTLECIIPDDGLTDIEFMAMRNYEIDEYLQTQDLFEYDDIRFGDTYAPVEEK